MSFGWSAGDILGAATVIWHIAKALRESTGAPEKYRNSIQQLEAIELQLNELTKFAAKYGRSNSSYSSTGGSDTLFSLDDVDSKALQRVLTELQESIEKLEEKISKYTELGADKSDVSDKKLRQRLQWHLSRAVKKLEWEFLLEEDAKALIGRIYQLTQSLSLLYQRANIETTEITSQASAASLGLISKKLDISNRKLDMLLSKNGKETLMELHSLSKHNLVQIGPHEGIAVDDARQKLYSLNSIEFSTMKSGVSQYACSLKVTSIMKDRISSLLSFASPPRLWLSGKSATTISATLFKILSEKGRRVLAFAGRHVDRQGDILSQERRLIQMVYSMIFQILQQLQDEESLLLVDVGGSFRELDATIQTLPLGLKILKYLLDVHPHCIVIVDGWDFLDKSNNTVQVNEFLRTFLDMFEQDLADGVEMDIYGNRLLLTTVGVSPTLSSLEKDYLGFLDVRNHTGKGPYKLSTIFQ